MSLEATCYLSIGENRLLLAALPIYSTMAGLETSEEDHHLYPGTIIASFIRWTKGITISIEVNYHTTSIIHTTLHDARVHGQRTPKAPTFCLQPIQPQPKKHEIQLYDAPLLVVPRGRHPPIIVSSTELWSHRSEGTAFEKKKTSFSLTWLGLRNKGDYVHASYFYIILYTSI